VNHIVLTIIRLLYIAGTNLQMKEITSKETNIFEKYIGEINSFV